MKDSANPWIGLRVRKGRYVHAHDLPFVEAFNRTIGDDRPAHRLVETAWPEPWVGPVYDSPVLILGANPGWTDADEEATKLPAIKQLLRANLEGTEPLVWLHPKVEGTPGAKWYRKRLLGPLLRHHDASQLSQAIAMIDFHAYHSRKWTALPVTLPTQQYTFDLVRRRLNDEPVVILTRAAREWRVAVPELADYCLCFETNSPQNSSLSPGNLPVEAWSAIIDRVDKHHP